MIKSSESSNNFENRYVELFNKRKPSDNSNRKDNKEVHHQSSITTLDKIIPYTTGAPLFYKSMLPYCIEPFINYCNPWYETATCSSINIPQVILPSYQILPANIYQNVIDVQPVQLLPQIISEVPQLAEIYPYVIPSTTEICDISEITNTLNDNISITYYSSIDENYNNVEFNVNNNRLQIEEYLDEPVIKNIEENYENSLEYYFKLSKDLFPKANDLDLDPNPLIDEFCKIRSIREHVPWILDLEFGIPKAPISRSLPIYDIQFNNIHCWDAPQFIHPGFLKCDKNFQNVLLYYYGCVVSAWYSGYVVLKNDKSMENFQSWILSPMQTLGMCWP